MIYRCNPRSDQDLRVVVASAESFCLRVRASFSSCGVLAGLCQVFSLLHWLNLIASDSHGDGSLNQLYRDDHTLVAADRRKDSLDSIEAPSPNTDVLPDVEKWIKLERNALLQHGVDSLNLGIGNRGANAANTYKVGYAHGAQYRHSLVLHRSNSHKHICGK